jgi:hypothetical protein
VSNVVNSAFTTIRAASQLKWPPVKTIHHTDNGPLVIHDLPGIIPSPFCSPWRHPIWWWKLRHLRADINLLESEVDPNFSRRMRELEEEAFIHGTGERTGQ